MIDWGDVCHADPAIVLRARVLSMQLCAVLAHYGHSQGQPEILRAGLDGLERTLA